MATNRIHEEGVLSVAVSHPSSPTTGQPVRYGTTTGVALTDEGEGGNSATETTVDFRQRVWDLSVEGTDEDGSSAVSVGDLVFYADSDGATLSKDPTGFFFGVALETVDSGSTSTIEVLHMPQSSTEGVAGVELADMADLSRGSLIAGGASDRPTALAAETDAQILVGDGTDVNSVAVSGDATIDNAGAVTIAADSVEKTMMAPGTGTKFAYIDGGAAGDHTVTGIATDDELIAVMHETPGTSFADLTSEFSISAADTINNDTGTDTSSDKLWVFYNDLT